MKLIASEKDLLRFQLEKKERQVLLALLALYPVIPAAHQRLSKNEDRPDGDQMLEAALAAHRSENKRLIQAMVNGATAFTENEEGCSLALSPGQIDWLLQVLNDVRVGSWIALGSPDGPDETLAALNTQTGRHFWAVEMAGYFQAGFLRALGAGQKENPAGD